MAENTAMKKNMVRVAYAPTSEDADKMTALLLSGGIEAAAQGGTRDIYTVNGKIGIEIMVPEDDRDNALAVLKDMAGVAAVQGENDDPEDIQKKPALSRTRALLSLAATILLFFCLIMLRKMLL